MNINSLILDAIETIVDEKLKTLKFNYTIECVVDSVNDDGLTIVYQNTKYQCSKLAGLDISQGDIAVVLVLNNNFSNKIAIGKR